MEAKAKLRFNRGIVVLLVLACFHALFSSSLLASDDVPTTEFKVLIPYEEIIESRKDYCERMAIEAEAHGKEPIHYDKFYYECVNK